MKKIYLASMIWPEAYEPICVGTNKKKITTEAVRILKEYHGNGPVERPQAFCSVPIRKNDIDIQEIPFF